MENIDYYRYLKEKTKQLDELIDAELLKLKRSSILLQKEDFCVYDDFIQRRKIVLRKRIRFLANLYHANISSNNQEVA